MRLILGDTETTGIKVTDKVCEVAWAEVDANLDIVASGMSLINPGIPIHYAASAVNGITDAMVADAPTLEEYMADVGNPLYGEDVVLVAHNCVTGDHEVRTRDGWVRLDQLTDGEEALQWDPATSALSFTEPTVVRKQYEGKMLQWESQYHKGIYTPEHRIYFKGRQGLDPDWRVTTAQEFAEKGPNSVVIPVSGVLDDGNYLDISPDEARVLEMIRADGNIQRKNDHCKCAVRLKFKKPEKIARCCELFDALEVSYRIWADSVGATSIRVYSEPKTEKLALLLGVGKDKRYGPWVMRLSPDARRALLDETQYWDGHVTQVSAGEKRQTSICSSKREDVLWLSEMAHFTGMSSKVKYDIPNVRGFSRSDSILHQVTIRPRTQVKTLYRPTEIDFIGTVYCLTVPTGAFLIRRNGATWVTGNCNFDHRYLKPYMSEGSRTLCTLKCARILYPDADNHKQSTIAAMLGITVAREKAHSADGDLDVLVQLLRRMCSDFNVSIEDLMIIQNQPRPIKAMPFGKYRGTPLANLPNDYIKWLLTKADNVDADLRAALEAL